MAQLKDLLVNGDARVLGTLYANLDGQITEVKSGTGLSGSGTSGSITISHTTPSNATNIKGPTADVTGSNGAKVKIPHIEIDALGHVKTLSEYEYTSVDTNTDTKVTAVGNHYTPAKSKTISASSSTSATWGSTDFVTGIEMDAAGHVTGVTSIQMPANPNSHYTANLITGASASATANAAVTTNGSVYMNLVENSTVRNSHNIVGSGATKVTSDANGKITINTDERLFTTLVPKGTQISTTGTDLNTITYLSVGKYFCSQTATAATFLNCPTKVAFMMEVYSPLATTIDNETTGTWVYRLRKIIEYSTGITYYQMCNTGSTANSWTYGAWYQVPENSVSISGTTRTYQKGNSNVPVYINNSGRFAKCNHLVHYIEGTGSTAGTWLGEDDTIDEYFPGLIVAYKIPVAGASPTTLNINGLGAVTVVRNATTNISTAYPVKSVAMFIYTEDSGTAYWKAADYDSNTNTQMRFYRQNYTGEYPLLASRTADTSIGTSGTNSSYSAGYGLVPLTSGLAPTIQPSTGRVTFNKDVLLSNSTTTPSTQPKFYWKTINNHTPTIGYAKDQTDGTFMIGIDGNANYNTGLAIGGGSGNLLWKGNKVATINDIPTSLKNPNSLTIQRNGTTIGSYDGSSAKTINIQASAVTLNGTATNSASFYAPTAAGTSGYPLISSGGTPTFTALKDSYIEWGGRNLTGTISPTDMATSSIHSANRFAFAKPAGITIEYSTDAGSTWTDYGSSDEVKIGLVSNINQALYVGARNGTSNSAPVNTVNDRLRVTLKATSMGVYTRLQKLLIYITTNYAKGCKVLIEKSNKGSATTFSTVGTYDISGWSGWNSIPLTANFGGGDTQTSNYDSIRLTFYFTTLTSGNYNNALTLINIVGLGETYWAYPSQMALDGHIYSYDTTQGVMFPSTLTCVNGLAVNNSNSGSTTFSIMSGANKDYSKQSLTSILSDSEPLMRTGFIFLDSNDAGEGITLLMGIKDNGVLGVGDTLSHSDDSLAAVHSDNDLLNGATLSTLTAAATTATSSRQYAVERDANGKLSVNVPWSNTTSSCGASNSNSILYVVGRTAQSTSTSYSNSAVKINCNASGTAETGSFTATKVYGAVWNDYAECRAQKEEIKPGYCVASGDDGKVYKTTEKFQACDGIVTDTFGFSIGETDECKTPLAVAGRVLAYAEDREGLHSGDTVCAGPNGKVVKMTREEIREWPDRIVGVVSEIPTYETWGTGNVKVDGRIWIKVK